LFRRVKVRVRGAQITHRQAEIFFPELNETRWFRRVQFDQTTLFGDHTIVLMSLKEYVKIKARAENEQVRYSEAGLI